MGDSILIWLLFSFTLLSALGNFGLYFDSTFFKARCYWDFLIFLLFLLFFFYSVRLKRRILTKNHEDVWKLVSDTFFYLFLSPPFFFLPSSSVCFTAFFLLTLLTILVSH